MLKLTKIAIIAAAVSLALAGAAEAKKPSHHQAWLDSLKAKGAGVVEDAASVGEAFDPNPEIYDPKAECIAAGRMPKTQMQDDGSIGYRCVPIYIFEQ